MNKEIKKILTIDISDSTIEIMETGLVNGKLKIFASARSEIKKGLVENGIVREEGQLSEIVLRLIKGENGKSMSSREAIFVLPNSLVYSHLFELKTGDDLISEKDIDKVIPIAGSDRLISTKNFVFNNKHFALILASSKKAATSWRNFFSSFGVELEGLEFSPLASFYGINAEINDDLLCIVDIGANTSNISFYNNKGLLYCFDIYKGGNTVTKTLALKNKTTVQKAENYKKEIDVSLSGQNDAKVILDFLEGLLKELEQNINYLQDMFRVSVGRIVLAGGATKQKGIKSFLENYDYCAPISLASPRYIENENIEFINTVGLAVLTAGLNKGAVARMRPEEYIEKKGIKSREVFVKKEIFNKIKLIFLNNKRASFLLLLLILFVFSGFYLLKVSKNENHPNIIEQEYPYNIKIPLLLEFDVNDNEVGVRVLKVKIDKAMELNKVLQTGMNLAEKEVRNNETIWEEPLNSLDSDNLLFPLYIEWLIYDYNKIKTASLEDLSVLMKDVKYILEEVTIDSFNRVEGGENYSFNISARIYSGASLEEISAKKTRQDVSQKKMIKVRDLGSNLNVRQGPGTSFPVVGQALSLGFYEYIKEENGWYQINLSKDIVGWVLGRLTEEQFN